jgi:hypothetical protein
MGHCKDCTNWNRWTKECDTLPARSYKTNEPPDDSFYVYAEADDDQGLQWGMRCGPNFGCVLFQARKTDFEVGERVWIDSIVNNVHWCHVGKVVDKNVFEEVQVKIEGWFGPSGVDAPIIWVPVRDIRVTS